MPIASYAIHHRTKSEDGALMPIGSRAEVLAALEVCNTAPDHPGGNVLYGPGLQIDLLPGEDPIRQMSLRITEQDIAWEVISRMRHQFGWRFTDLETGDSW
jgi:hypothetical protein